MMFKLVAALVLVFCAFVTVSEASLPQLKFHHRFSSHLKQKALSEGWAWPFPRQNSPEYHNFMKELDSARHGRMLGTTSPSSLTFSEGNFTVIFLGSLYYADIDVGTPNVPFFVALDTGSDLFWLPCQCKACAPASSPAYQGLPDLVRYNPSKSSTSSKVTCASSDCSRDFSLCEAQGSPGTGQCSYLVRYGTPNTSTSGVIYKDVLHLTPNDGNGPNLTSPIVLGCGETQTGSLVDGSSVPDGLLGLGRESFAVPSFLANSGIVGDSFSMCFNYLDLSGRVVFGDFGSPNQSTTPFQVAPPSLPNSYYVQLDSITVENKTLSVGTTILVDTGTSYTLLESSTHQAVITAFSSQIKNYKRASPDFGGSFELCYTASDSDLPIHFPSVTLNFLGGAEFSVLSPLVYFVRLDNTLAGFCLAVADGGDRSIFGANFMAGYNLIFNRKESTLGFVQANCYDTLSFPTSTTGLAAAPSPNTRPAHGPEASAPPPTPGGTRSPPGVVAPIAATPGGSPSSASSTTFSLITCLLSLALATLLMQ